MDSFAGDTQPSLRGFPESKGAQDVQFKDVWMPESEEGPLGSFKANINNTILLYTTLWFALHGVSMLILPYTGVRGLTKKDRFRWHNKTISLVHAALAFVQGSWWILFSGELQQLEGRYFGFFPANAKIAAVGAAYFVYDFLFCSLSSFYASEKHLPMILIHHAIFILAYYSTLIYPCVLSVSSYHYFQLTELSTVLLHLVWMLSKAQVPYAYLYGATVGLLATFLQRVVTTALIVWHVSAFMLQRRLWSVKLPHGLDRYTHAYVTYFLVCSVSMLIMNWTWFTMLTARARDMVKRVQNGQAPSPDYERRSTKDA